MENVIQDDDASLTQQGEDQAERERGRKGLREGGRERKEGEMMVPLEVDLFVFHQLAHLYLMIFSRHQDRSDQMHACTHTNTHMHTHKHTQTHTCTHTHQSLSFPPGIYSHASFLAPNILELQFANKCVCTFLCVCV